MNISLTKTDKSQNSTFRPSGWTNTTCSLKDMCDISTPELIFTNVDNAYQYNYAYMAHFNRYYFITEWTYERGSWIATCMVDVLATWRNTIADSYQFIMRSGRAGGYIDEMYAPTLDIAHTKIDINDIFSDITNDVTKGCYFVQIVGDTGAAAMHKGVTNYCMTYSEFSSLLNTISSTQYMGIDTALDDITENVAKLLINPAQFVIKANYVPIPYATFIANGMAGDYQDIRYGWYTFNSKSTVVSSIPTVDFELYNASFPKHPWAVPVEGQLYNYAQFKSERYTKYQLEYPFIGFLDIPNEILEDAKNLKLYVRLDLDDGTAYIFAETFDDNDVMKYRICISQTNWFIPIQLNSLQTNPFDVFKGIADSVKGVMAANTGNVAMLPEALSASATGLITLASSNIPSIKASGNNGGYSAYKFNRCMHVYTKRCGPDRAYDRHLGMSSLMSEYIKNVNVGPGNTKSIIMCANPRLEIINVNEPKYLSNEYDQIMKYMSEGFYHD